MFKQVKINKPSGQIAHAKSMRKEEHFPSPQNKFSAKTKTVNF
jgi:hypothetical protein